MSCFSSPSESWKICTHSLRGCGSLLKVHWSLWRRHRAGPCGLCRPWHIDEQHYRAELWTSLCSASQLNQWGNQSIAYTDAIAKLLSGPGSLTLTPAQVAGDTIIHLSWPRQTHFISSQLPTSPHSSSTSLKGSVIQAESKPFCPSLPPQVQSFSSPLLIFSSIPCCCISHPFLIHLQHPQSSSMLLSKVSLLTPQHWLWAHVSPNRDSNESTLWQESDVSRRKPF